MKRGDFIAVASSILLLYDEDCDMSRSIERARRLSVQLENEGVLKWD